MNLIDRIILTVYSFFLTLLSIVVVLTSVRLISLDLIWTYIENLYGQWEIGVIGLLLLFASIRFLVSGIKTKKHMETLIKNTQFGDIKISLNAIESTVIKAAYDITGVKNIKTKIIKFQEGIKLDLRVSLFPDVKITDITNDIQKNVKTHVEEVTGVSVKEIKITVENIAGEIRTRVS